jgi:hypothetical protein
MVLIACVVVIVVSALPGPGGAQAAPRHCGTLTIRAGSKEGAVTGADCFLSAFKQHCLPATYTLSIMGVDTFATDTFRLTRPNARCRFAVSVSLQVIPQPPRVHRGTCKTLTRKRAQVFATGCVGVGIPKTISLDPPTNTP